MVASSDEPGVRDAGGRLGGALRRPGPLRRQATRCPRRRWGAAPPRRHPGLRARAGVGDLRRGARSRSSRSRRASSGSAPTDPVENAIAFARYADGGFGWNINDPGHGFVIANADRPLDAAAAAPLSASGDLGPAAAHRRRGDAAGRAARLPARPQARLRGRPDPRRLQPRLADRRHDGDLGRPAGGGRRARRAGPGNVRLRAGAGSDSSIGPEPGTPESQPNAPKPDTNRDRDQR